MTVCCVLLGRTEYKLMFARERDPLKDHLVLWNAHETKTYQV